MEEPLLFADTAALAAGAALPAAATNFLEEAAGAGAAGLAPLGWAISLASKEDYNRRRHTSHSQQHNNKNTGKKN